MSPGQPISVLTNALTDLTRNCRSSRWSREKAGIIKRNERMLAGNRDFGILLENWYIYKDGWVTETVGSNLLLSYELRVVGQDDCPTSPLDSAELDQVGGREKQTNFGKTIFFEVGKQPVIGTFGTDADRLWPGFAAKDQGFFFFRGFHQNLYSGFALSTPEDTVVAEGGATAGSYPLHQYACFIRFDLGKK
jgi:hypothetical protein